MGEFSPFAFCRMNRPGGKAWSRTMNAYLNSCCHELWRGFAGAFCGMNRPGRNVWSRTTNVYLSSCCHELWASFRRLHFVE